MKKSLLATVAAIGLVAGSGIGSGIALAQEAPSKVEGATPAPPAQRAAPMEKVAPKMEPNKPHADTGKASDMNAGKNAAEEKSRFGKSETTAKGGSEQTNVTLSTQQKANIRATAMGPHVPRVNHVDFSISVGTVVPRTVHVIRVPSTLVEIHPAWRDDMYFVSGDEIVIVEPRTLRIVAVLDV